MRYKQDSFGRWVVEPSPLDLHNASRTLSERFYGCKPDSVTVDRKTEKEDGRERSKAKVSKSLDCYVAEEEEEEPLAEWLEQKWFDEIDALADETRAIVEKAKEEEDSRALEAIRARFMDFLPQPPKESLPEEPVNAKHSLKMESKRRSQRLKAPSRKR